MDFNDFSKLVLNRQSCRDFSDEPLNFDDLNKVLELSRFTPSARNIQPWKMYLVKSPEKMREVNIALQKDGHNRFLDKAKAFLVLTEPINPIDGAKFVKYDVGELIAYITLSAKALGIETCIIGWMDEEKLSKAVGYSKSEFSQIAIAFGKSNCALRVKNRKELKDILKVL